MPYRYRDDIATADVAFEAWGKTREELFIACAEALLGAMVDDPGLVARQTTVAIREEAEALDLLLFAFLQELIFYKDARRLLLHADSIRIATQPGIFSLEAEAAGEEIDPGRHRLLVDVKAVTLHRFEVVCDGHGCRATVVLDV